MQQYGKRTYRKRIKAGDMVSFHVGIKETDLWINADVDLKRQSRDLVFDCRHQIETYIRRHPLFANALLPYEEDPYAPPLVKEMIDITRRLKIGPMASVAGTIAQHVGIGLLKLTDQVIVENGGDIFIKANRPITVSIFAGTSPLSERYGLLVPVRQMPIGVCSSSAKVGHSLSIGIADVVCMLSSFASLADGAATALGNKIKKKKDVEGAAAWANNINGILGGVVIVENKMVAWGDIELVEL